LNTAGILHAIEFLLEGSECRPIRKRGTPQRQPRWVAARLASGGGGCNPGWRFAVCRDNSSLWNRIAASSKAWTPLRRKQRFSVLEMISPPEDACPTPRWRSGYVLGERLTKSQCLRNGAGNLVRQRARRDRAYPLLYRPVRSDSRESAGEQAPRCW